jgi:hypothetical protein
MKCSYWGNASTAMCHDMHLPSMVGSYSSTKWLWINWIVKADFPTPEEDNVRLKCKGGQQSCEPPPPTTTSLYSLKNWAYLNHQLWSKNSFSESASTLAAIDKTLNKEERERRRGSQTQSPLDVTQHDVRRNPQKRKRTRSKQTVVGIGFIRMYSFLHKLT